MSILASLYLNPLRAAKDLKLQLAHDTHTMEFANETQDKTPTLQKQDQEFITT